MAPPADPETESFFGDFRRWNQPDLISMPVRIAAMALVIGFALILALRVRRQRSPAEIAASGAYDEPPVTLAPEPPVVQPHRVTHRKRNVEATPMDLVLAQNGPRIEPSVEHPAVTATPAPTAERPAVVTESPAHPVAAHESAGAPLDSALELAEIMLSMGLSSSASNALIDHIREHPKQALAHWLKLLDIYRRDGHRSDFERTAREMRQNFNIHADDWLGMNKATRSLEDFERVLKQISSLCEQPQALIEYLTHLLEDNREGIRVGFPQAVAEEMMLLMAMMRDRLRAEVGAAAETPAVSAADAAASPPA